MTAPEPKPTRLYDPALDLGPLDPEPRQVGGPHIKPWMAPPSPEACDRLDEVITEAMAEAGKAELTTTVGALVEAAHEIDEALHPEATVDPDLDELIEALDRVRHLRAWEAGLITGLDSL